MTLLSSLLSENLKSMLTSMIQTFPRLVGGIVLIIVGVIISKILARSVKSVTQKLGIDKLGDRINQIDLVANANFEFKLSEVLSKIVYYFAVLIFVVAATDVIGMPAISQLFNDLLAWIPNLLVALVILTVGIIFADFIKGIIKTACDSFNIPSSKLISMFAFYFLVINIVISALSQAQVDTTFISSNLSILIGGAALAFAIAYGLASRNVLSNFLTAHYSTNHVKVGDEVTIEGHRGVVKHMDRTNITLSSQGKTTVIPLHKLSTETIEIHHQN